jgi:hypothetical protein
MVMSSEARLLAKAEITDCLAIYARGVDRRQWSLVLAAYHDDAFDDHGAYKGDIPGLIEWVREKHANVPHSMHILSNCLIEFVSPDRALVETYFESCKTIRPTDAGESGTGTSQKSRVLGRYIDIFERRAGRWAIARRSVVTESVEFQDIVTPIPDTSNVGRRDDEDVLTLVRRELGVDDTASGAA